MPKKVSVIIFFLSLTMIFACVTDKKSRRKGPKKVLGRSGVIIPEYGLTIGAHYNPELDSLLKGYKIITIALTNNSINQLRMDPGMDVWKVKTHNGGRVKAINSLQQEDPRLWRTLPEKTKELMEYPVSVPTGYTQTFDIFVKSNANLDNFQSIAYINDYFGVTFQILNSD